jgi:hypothetical protein
MRVWGQSRVASVTMNMIKQERGWAQATTELDERERTSFPAALARFPCGHTATAFKGTRCERCRIFADVMRDPPQTQFYFERLATPRLDVVLQATPSWREGLVLCNSAVRSHDNWRVLIDHSALCVAWYHWLLMIFIAYESHTALSPK